MPRDESSSFASAPLTKSCSSWKTSRRVLTHPLYREMASARSDSVAAASAGVDGTENEEKSICGFSFRSGSTFGSGGVTKVTLTGSVQPCRHVDPPVVDTSQPSMVAVYVVPGCNDDVP